MVKVFLVDDEIVIREGIRNSFPWEESGYTLVGEAPDGEIALPMIRDANPDILITDIRMPFMDGMQLCREVKRQMPWIGVVILSGYDDFTYARQAISLGVKEYLLKPVTAQELKEVLDRISARLAEERRAREDMALMRRRLHSGSQFVKEKLLSSLFTDEPMEDGDADAMIEQMRTLGINLAAKCYAVIDMAFSSADGSLSVPRAALYALAESSGGIVQVCAAKHGARALVLGDSEDDTEDRAYSFASSALNALERSGCTGILLAIGEIVSRFADIRLSMRSARHTRHLMAARPGAGMRIMGVREAADTPDALKDLDLRPLHERLQYAAADELDQVFGEYVASLGAADLHSAVAADYLHVEALMTASRIIREAGGDPARELKREWSDGGGEDAAYEMLRTALCYRDQHVSKGGSSVAKARAYLSQHFAEPNLMLQDVARAACMSNSRLSTVFAQETGYTFTEYLTALRIGKAKELLRLGGMRSSQVAFAVGYNDPHYFSYLFKKTVGMTPSEYRRENENQPE